MEGYRVVTMEYAADKADIFVTTTGNYHVITHDNMAAMKDQAIVCNIGHFDNEIDVASLEKYQWEEIKPQVDHVIFPSGRRIILLARHAWLPVLRTGYLLVSCSLGFPYSARIMGIGTNDDSVLLSESFLGFIIPICANCVHDQVLGIANGSFVLHPKIVFGSFALCQHQRAGVSSSRFSSAVPTRAHPPGPALPTFPAPPDPE